MIVYLMFYLVVLLLAYATERLYYSHRLKQAKWLILINVFLLSLFAAVRSIQVGTDVTVYLTSAFRDADYSGLLSFLSSRSWSDILFYTSVWIVRKFSSNVHVYLFIHQLFTSAIVFYIAYKNFEEKQESFVLYIFMYLMMWYGTTFNILRQSMGITLLLLGFDLLLDKRWKSFMIVVGIAALFHASLLIAIAFPLIVHISERRHNRIYTFFAGIVSLLALQSLQSVFNFVNVFGVFEQYNRFFVLRKFSTANFNIHYFIIKVIIFAGLTFFIFLTRSAKKRAISILYNFSVFDLFGYCVSMVVRFGYRISYPFLVFQILYIPKLDKEIKFTKNRRIFRAFIIISMMVYFYWRYVKIGYDGIIPYQLFLND